MRYDLFTGNRIYYSLLLLLGIGTWGCQQTETPPAPDTSGLRGLFVLNEGRWQQNDASISFFNPEADYAAEHYLFSRVNGVRLGDVAHSAVREADTLFVVVNNSRLVYKILLPSLRLLGQVALPASASPREFLRLGPRKAYINSLLDGTIYVIDPTTMELLPTRIAVENWMESMQKLEGKVWISCGNYAYPNRNNKLAMVDPQTDRLEGYLELPIENPGPMLTLPDGRLLVGLRGNYIDTNSGLAVVDPQARRVDTLIRLAGSLYGMNALPDGIWLFNDSTVTRFDPQTFGVRYQYLTREQLGAGARDWLYGAYWDAGRQQYYVCNAENAAVAGSVVVLDAQRRRIRSLRAGVLPKQVIVYP
jgi:DNA-binding beta-propeller fold protein YncE